jgi:hypothetical protein
MLTKDQSPPKTFAEGELYVFISYARPDQAVAEKVEAFLTVAGVRVFRDSSDIRAGASLIPLKSTMSFRRVGYC